jgi:hypothetical protein
MSIDRMGASPQDSESTTESRVNSTPSEAAEPIEAQLARARRELDSMRAAQRQVMELIGCDRPEKLVHDLRNVLNELQLLRMLADMGKC